MPVAAPEIQDLDAAFRAITDRLDDISGPPISPNTQENQPSPSRRRIAALLGAGAMLLPVAGSVTEQQGYDNPCTNAVAEASAVTQTAVAQGQPMRLHAIVDGVCRTIEVRPQSETASRSRERTIPNYIPPTPVEAPAFVEPPITVSYKQKEVLNTLRLSDKQRAFLERGLIAIEGLRREGKVGDVDVVVMLAQAIHESGWGSSGLYGQNNVFGMKPTKGIDAGRAEFWTFECEPKCRPRKAVFMTFPTEQAGYEAYVKQAHIKFHFADALLRHGNFPYNTATNLETLANLLDDGMAYATDPNYVQKVMHYVHQYRLQDLLRPEPPTPADLQLLRHRLQLVA